MLLLRNSKGVSNHFITAIAMTIGKEATEKIKKHLSMVFIHEIDPSFPENQQSNLNQVHDQWPNNLPPGARC